MPPAPRPERPTQNRVIERLTTPPSAGGLGYAKRGNWSQRDGNRCIELEHLRGTQRAVCVAAESALAALEGIARKELNALPLAPEVWTE